MTVFGARHCLAGRDSLDGEFEPLVIDVGAP